MRKSNKISGNERIVNAMVEGKERSEKSVERESWRVKKSKFGQEFVKDPDIKKASLASGISPEEGRLIIKSPDVQAVIEEGLSAAAVAAGLSRQWVLEKLRDVALRCMQGEAVLDREGNETGEWKFDSGGANRALELIGKHVKLFGEEERGALAQLGTAVIRVLAQEAQAARLADASKPIDSEAERVPSSESQSSLAPGSVDTGGAKGIPTSAPVSP